MAGGYSGRSANGAPKPGSGAAAAHTWLTKAKATLSTGASKATAQVWALPYADPDLASVANAPTSLADRLRGQVTTAATYHAAVIDSQLGAQPAGTLAWPAAGQADPATLRLAQVLRPAAAVLSGSSLPLQTPNERYTPSGRSSIDGIPAAVSDPALDSVLDGDPADADAGNGSGSAPGLLAGQRFIAETALITTQQQSQRAIVVQAPRDFAPSSDLLAALRDVTGSNWVDYVGLSTVLHSQPDPEVSVGPLTRSRASVSADRSAASLTKVADFGDDLASFASILTTPSHATGPYDPVVLRALSTSWRGTSGASGPDAFLAAAGGGPDGLETQRSNVSMVPKSSITLSGKSGSVPITIVNNLAQPVRLRLDVTSLRPDVLRITAHPMVTVDPGSQQIVQVAAHASGSGVVVPVHVRLLTPNGTAYGRAQDIQVHVTNIGVIALVILLGSAALVVLAVVLRLYRAARKRREPGTGGGGDGSPPGAPGPGGPDGEPRDDTARRASFVPQQPQDVHNGGTDGRSRP
jgi:hypothetical protein